MRAITVSPLVAAIALDCLQQTLKADTFDSEGTKHLLEMAAEELEGEINNAKREVSRAKREISRPQRGNVFAQAELQDTLRQGLPGISILPPRLRRF